MEPQHFDLQRSITDFVQTIRFNGGLDESDASELTTHLIDSVEDLRKGGLSQEEAFLIATHRLGTADDLSREYRKVNPVLLTDRIWAYMLLGFSLLTSLGWLYTGGYTLTMRYAGAPVCIGYNIAVCVFVWSVLFWGSRFSAWVHRTTERQPWLTLLLSLGPVLILFRGRMVPFVEPRYATGLTLFTHYLTIVSMAAVLLLSVFSISLPGRLTFRALFGRLPVMYIPLFGFVIEIVAAMTRVWQDVPMAAVLFSAIYAAGAFCVAFFRERGQVLWALLLYALPGLVAETWGGTLADKARGGTHYTVYFIAAIVAAAALGGVAARVTAARSRDVSVSS